MGEERASLQPAGLVPRRAAVRWVVSPESFAAQTARTMASLILAVCSVAGARVVVPVRRPVIPYLSRMTSKTKGWRPEATGTESAARRPFSALRRRSRDLAQLSHYLTSHILRFGAYATDELHIPPDVFDPTLAANGPRPRGRAR